MRADNFIYRGINKDSTKAKGEKKGERKGQRLGKTERDGKTARERQGVKEGEKRATDVDKQ